MRSMPADQRGSGTSATSAQQARKLPLPDTMAAALLNVAMLQYHIHIHISVAPSAQQARSTALPPTRHIMHVAQQVGEGPGAAARAVGSKTGQVAAVGVNVLAQQRDLLVAGLPQRQHFAPDGLGRAALLRAAREGHDAVGALQWRGGVGGVGLAGEVPDSSSRRLAAARPWLDDSHQALQTPTFSLQPWMTLTQAVMSLSRRACPSTAAQRPGQTSAH